MQENNMRRLSNVVLFRVSIRGVEQAEIYTRYISVNIDGFPNRAVIREPKQGKICKQHILVDSGAEFPYSHTVDELLYDLAYDIQLKLGLVYGDPVTAVEIISINGIVCGARMSDKIAIVPINA